MKWNATTTKLMLKEGRKGIVLRKKVDGYGKNVTDMKCVLTATKLL